MDSLEVRHDRLFHKVGELALSLAQALERNKVLESALVRIAEERTYRSWSNGKIHEEIAPHMNAYSMNELAKETLSGQPSS